MTWLQCSSRPARRTNIEISRDGRPISDGERRSASAAVLLKQTSIESRRKTTTGTSTASKMLVRSAVGAFAATSSLLAAWKAVQPAVRGTLCVVLWRRRKGVQFAAHLQHGISNCRKKLTQCQQQRLGWRHVEGGPIVREQPTFKNTGFVRADCFAERIGYRALQPSVVLYRNQVRVIRSEPRQHDLMNIAGKVGQQERAEDRKFTLFAKLIEQVLEAHAGGDVAALPQDIDHFSPQTYPLVASSSARLGDDFTNDAGKYSRIGHGVPHEAGQEF